MSSLLLLLAITPVVLICTYIYLKDKNKEPWLLLLKLFFFGAVSCFLVLLVSKIVFLIFPFMNQDTSKMTFFQVMTYSFIGVALVEESCKWLMTWLGVHKSKSFDEVYDGIVYAVYVSLGFAFIENILYVLGSQSISLGITRGILAVPGHACDAVFMGYYLSLAKAYSKIKDKKKTNKNLLLSVLAPTILHGYYDFCLFAGNIILLVTFIIFIVALWVFSIKKIKKLSNMAISLNKKENNKNKKTEENSSLKKEITLEPKTTQSEPSNNSKVPPIVHQNQTPNPKPITLTPTSASTAPHYIQLNQTSNPKPLTSTPTSTTIAPQLVQLNQTGSSQQIVQPPANPTFQFNQPSPVSQTVEQTTTSTFPEQQ